VPDVDDPVAHDTLLRNIQVESVILLLGVVGLARLLANMPPAYGVAGHAGHAMMAIITVAKTGLLRKEITNESALQGNPGTLSSRS
jgi:hypothetical protein